MTESVVCRKWTLTHKAGDTTTKIQLVDVMCSTFLSFFIKLVIPREWMLTKNSVKYQIPHPPPLVPKIDMCTMY